MFSWEYPPHIIGGISTHVAGLAGALVRTGHDVTVVTLHHADAHHGTVRAPDDEVVDGVRVVRADASLPWLPDDDLVARTASANHRLVARTATLGAWTPDVVHTHDWFTAWAGDTVAALHGVPLVATMHATERGRHGGHLPPGLPAAVNAVEWWLTYQAREVIACSQFMVREVIADFELPSDKVHLVPNGVDVERWRIDLADICADRPPLVVAWGRVQYEKGFQILARAMRDLRTRVPGVRCVIAGRGSYLPELQSLLDIEGVSDIVHLAGFVADDDLRRLLAEASCVVIPSLYEPFGIVALEGMAAGAAIVVARTGGLAEIVAGTGAGVLFEPGDPHDLAVAIAGLIDDPTRASALRAAAAMLLRDRYSWDAIAESTAQVYVAARAR